MEKKKTVGIITLYGLENYGNRLQNYAVQKTLTDMGLESKTYCKYMYWGCFGKKYRIKKALDELSNYRYAADLNNRVILNRQMLFEDFQKKYLPTEQIEDVKALGKKADYFVVGSDQVWNPTWYRADGVEKELFLLSFAEPEQKVCLSPSFGISELPDEWKTWFKEQLPTFPKLNVREQAGADIIKELTGLDAQVTIDPTLMLDAKDWRKISRKPYGVDTRHPYVLTYFLGDRTSAAEEDIREILNIRKMNVFHLLDKTQPFVYESGPREFIYLFSKADIILTDSFHACVFSFLFNKPFVVYDRVEDGMCQMTSRLDSLLTMLNLERKRRAKNEAIEWFECNYNEGKRRLMEERKILREFLESSFS